MRPSTKEIITTAVVLVLSLLLFLRLNTMSATSLYVFVLTALIIMSILWVVLTVISLGLIRSKAAALSIILGIPLILIIIGKAHVGVIGAALILTLILYIARARSKQEVNNRIKYSTMEIFGVSVRLIFIGLIVCVTGLYMSAINNAFNSEEIAIPEQPIELVLKPFEQIIQNNIPGYSSQATVNQIIQGQLEQQLEALPPGTVIPPASRAAALRDLSKRVGYELTGEETLSQVITRTINKQINNTVKRSPLIATLSVIVFIIMVARFISTIFVWPLLGLVALVIYIARKTNFVQLIISEEPVERLWL